SAFRPRPRRSSSSRSWISSPRWRSRVRSKDRRRTGTRRPSTAFAPHISLNERRAAPPRRAEPSDPVEPETAERRPQRAPPPQSLTLHDRLGPPASGRGVDVALVAHPEKAGRRLEIRLRYEATPAGPGEKEGFDRPFAVAA